MDRKELLKSPEYWTASIQMELYRQIEAFMKEKNFNKTQLAQYLGCSKGYITQLLSGDFDHKLSKFIQLSLAIGKIPTFNFMDADEYILDETYRPLRNPGKYKGGIYGYPHSLIDGDRMYVVCSVNKEDIHLYAFDLAELQA